MCNRLKKYLASISERRRFCRGWLCHLGFFLVIVATAGGSTEGWIKIYEGQTVGFAADSEGRRVPLGFDLTLKSFETEYYEDGHSPRQYTSTLEADGKALEASVNHPARYKGWRICQSGYGEGYSVLKAVKNPWIPVLSIGALLLALGAAQNLTKAWTGRKILPVALALAVVFTLISVARINFGTLMPALRSFWFIPHLAAYMLAYALLAVGTVCSFVRRIPQDLPSRLISSASSLLLIGMLCGAVWAQQAWGSYWSWDPKECWAAVTWLLTVAACHMGKRSKRLFRVLIITAFLAMNITWYGVNYLPSERSSIHVYR